MVSIVLNLAIVVAFGWLMKPLLTFHPPWYTFFRDNPLNWLSPLKSGERTRVRRRAILYVEKYLPDESEARAYHQALYELGLLSEKDYREWYILRAKPKLLDKQII